MRAVLIVAAVVLTIPLLTLAVLYARAGKVVIVRNQGASSIEIGEMISDGLYVERTDRKVLPAGETTWSFFFPKTKGALKLSCVGGGTTATISLGVQPSKLLFSRVVLDGCNRIVSRSAFAL
jgi:hypothetical protein